MSLAEILDDLTGVRREFGRAAARRKVALLRRASRLPCMDPRELLGYHETLLFLVAYPDDAEVRRRAEAELRRCADAARRLVRDGPRRAAARLDESGLAHTRTTCAFSYDTTAWLAERFGRSVDLAWEDDGLGAAFDDFLPALVAAVEGDGVRSDGLSTRAWLRLARGRAWVSDLAWVLDGIDGLGLAGPARDRLFESLGTRVTWRLTHRDASRTYQRLPARPIFHHGGPLVRRVDLGDWIDRPLPAVRPLPVAAARCVIDVTRAALCVRHRETDPVTYATPREVYLVRLERGFDLAILGMQPDRRLPIESFFGYLLAKNRVPMAYGGGWVFLDRCEIGINVFDTFRGGESMLAFAQILRVYRGLFGARLFTVDPYQFGADNPEAIRSGAFWFYYRFGFRPADERLRTLAAREWEKLQADRTHRTPAATLRRFAQGTLRWVVDPRDGAGADPPDVADLGRAITASVGRRYGGRRAVAMDATSRRLTRVLGAGDVSRWPPTERDAFRRMSLLADLAPDVTRWPAPARRALVRLMRAKGGPRERVYAAALRRHVDFRRALHALAGNAR